MSTSTHEWDSVFVKWKDFDKELKFQWLLKAASDLNYNHVLAFLDDPIFNRIDLTILANNAIKLDFAFLCRLLLSHPIAHSDDIERWYYYAYKIGSFKCIKEFNHWKHYGKDHATIRTIRS